MDKKRIFIMIMMGIFLISLTSATEFDNKLIYSNNDLKINLTNWFGLGEDYGSAELKSHISVDGIKKVSLGEQIVME